MGKKKTDAERANHLNDGKNWMFKQFSGFSMLGFATIR